jgi:hypothetical protein
MDRIGANIIYVDRRAVEGHTADLGVDDIVASNGAPAAETVHLEQSIRALKDAFGGGMCCESLDREAILVLTRAQSKYAQVARPASLP